MQLDCSKVSRTIDNYIPKKLHSEILHIIQIDGGKKNPVFAIGMMQP